jgi:cytochrome c6
MTALKGPSAFLGDGRVKADARVLFPKWNDCSKLLTFLKSLEKYSLQSAFPFATLPSLVANGLTRCRFYSIITPTQFRIRRLLLLRIYKWEFAKMCSIQQSKRCESPSMSHLWSSMKKRIYVSAAVATALVAVVSLPLSMRARTASDTPYTSKCAGCHGSDGTRSAMGKTIGAHDFTSAQVQRMSGAELTDIITHGKGKMPAYGKSLKPDDIKGLVAYIRTLKK